MNEERGSFGSRLGFILVSAGCAIGIGNVWKFPYVAGANGGAVFVLFYLVFLVLMGIPVMTMELAIGRASGKTVVRGYQKLQKKGQHWHIHGWLCMLGCYLLMMYYTTVSGWMVDYFFKFASGQFSRIDPENVGDVFTSMLADPEEMGIFMALTVIFGFGVLSLGVADGLERVNKIMMIGLLALIIVLAGHSLTLSNAAEGVKFYLLPDWNRAMEVGIGKVISAAMNQAFFTLSLGIGAIEIFGSYMSKDHTLTGEAVRICALDTFVALIAGLIIFPACFSFNVEPGQGPSLIFITLPRVFMNMNMGRIWGTLFFVFMTFASFSTVTAVFENLVAFLSDNFGWSRGKSILVNGAFILIASIPCVLGYNVWSDLHIIGARDVLDSEDFIVSNLLLPGGSLIFLLFCTTKFGWGFDKYLAETNTGSGREMPAFLKNYFKFVLPILILIILIQGLIP
ncbi:sodium-dependent transporter [Butyrivibrio sp. XPD2002]|uniref:sodium-dependent transporter n=1 Tax=Butyrivibrio sp. XPD2002 TaxID=1280665 RepID=UPI00040D62F2|nr:sodium-dependent transporter [Butyrivibrio sp. XPD2002]